MALRAVKKITARDVMGKTLEKVEINVPVLNEDNTPVLDKDGEPVMRKAKVVQERDMYAVFGNASGHRVAKSNFGDTMVFVGNFEARRIADGEIFISTECIFPPIAIDLATSAYMREKAKNPDVSVEFAFVIGVTPDASGTEGFKFTCKPIKVGEATSDPLADLKSSLASSFAEALGLDAMASMGLPAPGEKALLIDAQTGEVKDEPKPKAKTA